MKSMSKNIVGLVTLLTTLNACGGGKDGKDGEPGPQGEMGEQGDAGEMGEQGPQGEMGEQGDAGEMGDAGGAGGAGPMGEQGPQGEMGEQGPQGEMGEQGDAGSLFDGLVGYWTFAGGEAFDLSGNENDGVLLDASPGNGDTDTPPVMIGGAKGQALSFDGVDDYVQIDDDPSIDITGSAITVEALVQWDGIYQTQAFINKELQYELGFNSSGRLIGAINTTDAWGWLDSGWDVPPNEWVHVAMTYDGTTVSFYGNGQKVGEVAHPQGGTITSISQPLRFGARDVNTDDTADLFNDMDLDEVRVWNRVLSPTEIAFFSGM